MMQNLDGKSMTLKHTMTTANIKKGILGRRNNNNYSLRLIF